MISSLTGKIEAIETDTITINVNGIGFLVYVPTREKFERNNISQTIYTYLYVREDRIALYGFSTKRERDFFKVLIDTPGIGPKVALKIISDIGPDRFTYAVLSENLTIISSISGIGLKLAKKIILELKEKFKQLNIVQDSLVKEDKNKIIFEGIEALKGLGYREKEAKKRILYALEKISDQNSVKIEDLIKKALHKE
uniref:Holliday junction branch migration complex subunit RuvA n=1 Tax=uncultured Atribacterota bacterium TaxID=263865 RepID=G3BMS0_9BACT|nr:Holliday junction resolvasome DNA-binding subunit [uncultured Atribacterota bacterium]